MKWSFFQIIGCNEAMTGGVDKCNQYGVSNLFEFHAMMNLNGRFFYIDFNGVKCDLLSRLSPSATDCSKFREAMGIQMKH